MQASKTARTWSPSQKLSDARQHFVCSWRQMMRTHRMMWWRSYHYWDNGWLCKARRTAWFVRVVVRTAAILPGQRLDFAMQWSASSVVRVRWATIFIWKLHWVRFGDVFLYGKKLNGRSCCEGASFNARSMQKRTCHFVCHLLSSRTSTRNFT